MKLPDGQYPCTCGECERVLDISEDGACIAIYDPECRPTAITLPPHARLCSFVEGEEPPEGSEWWSDFVGLNGAGITLSEDGAIEIYQGWALLSVELDTNLHLMFIPEDIE